MRQQGRLERLEKRIERLEKIAALLPARLATVPAHEQRHYTGRQRLPSSLRAAETGGGLRLHRRHLPRHQEYRLPLAEAARRAG